MGEKKTGTRLNKYLSEIGHCSRRSADKLIEEGRIKVNGKAVIMGQKVTPEDKILGNNFLKKNFTLLVILKLKFRFGL